MVLKLYVDLRSQPCRALHIFLNVTKIPFETIQVDIVAGEHRREEFLKLNPFSKMPVIEEDGVVLTESVAMLRYLVREKKLADHWYPSDSKKQARVDEYLEWQHLNARLLCAMYFQHKVAIPRLTKKPVDPVAVDKAFQAMQSTLKQMEEIWLDGGKKKFLLGDEITVADLLGVCELEQPAMAGYDVFALHPILGQWRHRVKQITGSFYEEAHQILREIGKLSGLPPAKA